MTPARTRGARGSYIINRRFKNVGVIKKSLGTTVPAVHRDRVALIRRIHKQEHYELLRHFAKPRSEISIETLIELDRRGELGSWQSVLKLRVPLWDTVEKLLPTLAESTVTTTRYAKSARALQRKGKKWLPDRATVGDLAGVKWKELKKEWKASGTDYMHMRRFVGRFLTVHLGHVHHPFRLEVMNKENFPTARQNKRRPSLAPEQFQEIIELVPEGKREPYWAVLILGLRLGEYTAARPEHLNEATHTLFVPGRKTEDSEGLLKIDPRVWPIVSRSIPARHTFRHIEDVWAAAVKASGQKRITIHDLRHVHGQWAIDAGVPESMVQASFRHKSPGMTRDYVMQRDSGVVSSAIADVLTTPKRKRA